MEHASTRIHFNNFSSSLQTPVLHVAVAKKSAKEVISLVQDESPGDEKDIHNNTSHSSTSQRQTHLEDSATIFHWFRNKNVCVGGFWSHCITPCSKREKLNKLSYLLDHQDMDVNFIDRDKKTPLCYALFRFWSVEYLDPLAVILLLLSKNANANCRQSQMTLFLNFLNVQAKTEIVDLMEYGANLYARDDRGWYSLQCASM